MENSKFCSRCRGCGQVIGAGDYERPWTRFEGISSSAALQVILGVQHPEPCPTCQGTGHQPAEATGNSDQHLH